VSSYLLWAALILLGPSIYFEESMMNRINQQVEDLKSAATLTTRSKEHTDIAVALNRTSLQDKAQGHALHQNATRAWNRSQAEHVQSVQDYQLAKDYTTKALNETNESEAYKSLTEALESQYENEMKEMEEESSEISRLTDEHQAFCHEWYLGRRLCDFVGHMTGPSGWVADLHDKVAQHNTTAVTEKNEMEQDMNLADTSESKATADFKLAAKTIQKATKYEHESNQDQELFQQLRNESQFYFHKSEEEFENAELEESIAWNQIQKANAWFQAARHDENGAALSAVFAILFALPVLYIFLDRLINIWAVPSLYNRGTVVKSLNVPGVRLEIFLHIFCFLLMMGIMDKSLVFLLDDTTHVRDRGGIVLLFAVRTAAAHVLLVFGLSRVASAPVLPHFGKNDDSSFAIPVQAIVNGTAKTFVLPTVLYSTILLILVNLEFAHVVVALSWYLMLLLVLSTAVYLIRTTEERLAPQVDAALPTWTSSTSSAGGLPNEKTPLFPPSGSEDIYASKQNAITTKSEAHQSEEESLSPSFDTIDLESPGSSLTTSSFSIGACYYSIRYWAVFYFLPHLQALLHDEIISIGYRTVSQQAAKLDLFLTIMVVARMVNLLFWSCLPTLHGIWPRIPTWLVFFITFAFAVRATAHAVHKRRMFDQAFM
jgi:hypothetical protein